MMDFYDLIDTYAQLNGIDKNEVLHLWYRGVIGPEELLQAWLNDEGIYGYKDSLVRIIKTLGAQSRKDGLGDPWND